MKRSAFTLLEMLLASMLAALLMGALLMVLTAIARDRAAYKQIDAAPSARFDCLRWDLCNAETMTTSSDGRMLILVGHGALDRAVLSPTGRLARVTYRAAGAGRTFTLMRDQTLLDDPAHPEQWTELVAGGISGVWVTSAGTSADDGVSTSVPPRVHLRIESSSGATDQDIWIR